MLILAFDTTNENGGVGIFRDADGLVSIPNDSPANRFSVTLFETVERALARAHLELRDIELYAAANGPGSFTGIRVGLAAGRAWGKAFDRPVRGVSVLAAMVGKAQRCAAGEPAEPVEPDCYFPLLDARRGEFYLGSFGKSTSVAQRDSGGILRKPEIAEIRDYLPADEGWVLNPQSVREVLNSRVTKGASATCIVRAHDQATIDLAATLPNSIRCQRIEGTLVDAIAHLAQEEELAHLPRSSAQLEAYYIRRPDAEINWKD